MRSFRRSLALSFAQRYSVAAIQLVSMVVIARLLSPAEIGVFAISFSLIAFLHAFCESGIDGYIIQERELTDDRIRTAFTIALLGCWSLALVLVAAHDAVARLFADPRVGSAVLVLSCTFIVLPVKTLVLALLRRRMAFGVLYVAGTVAAFVSAATAILLASLGMGFMALAWSVVAETLAITLAAWLWRVDIPRGPLGLRDWRRVVAFAGRAAPASGLNGLGKLTANLAAGRMLGIEAVGLLNRARRVVDLFSEGVLQAVAPVALPALAAHHREGKALKGAYLLKVAMISGAAWPFFLFVALTAHLLVPVLLGDQWDAAVPITRALCLIGLALPFHVADGKFLMVLGRVRAYLWIQVAQQVFSVALILAACLVSIQMVALALGVGKLVKVLLTNAVLSDELGYTARDLAASCGKSLGLTLAGVIGPVAVLVGFGPGAGSPFLGLAAASLGLAAGWLVAVFALDHPLRREIENGWRQARAYVTVRASA